MHSKVGCIYCGADNDLSVSDIIPDALTNGKICNRNVCRIAHNNKFSDAFEYDVIEGLAAITNALNVKSSKGKNYAKYSTEIIIDGITYNTKISAETELFLGEKVFKSEDGKNFFGPLDKLTRFKNANVENISKLDINEMLIEKRITIDLAVFFSNSMYRLIAKMAFEWYCLCNDIQNKCDELEPIIRFIVDGIGNNPVNIICNEKGEVVSEHLTDIGNHTLISYVPEDGSLNVLIDLFGMALYNVKLSETVPVNCKYKINYVSINLDGKRTEFKAKTEKELLFELTSEIRPVGKIGDFQIMIPQTVTDNTIVAKMLYMTSERLHKGLDFDIDETKIRENLKKNINYILNRSALTVHGLKRFVKEYERVISAGIELSEKQVETRMLFQFYLLFMLGDANGEINSFEELNNRVVNQYGGKEIRLSKEICMKMQEEIVRHDDYSNIIKRGANIVLNM